MSPLAVGIFSRGGRVACFVKGFGDAFFVLVTRPATKQ